MYKQFISGSLHGLFDHLFFPTTATGLSQLLSGATRQVGLEEVDFRLLLVKQVFTNENSSAGIRYLALSGHRRPDARLRPNYGPLSKTVWCGGLSQIA
jgi:hypothetical protein